MSTAQFSPESRGQYKAKAYAAAGAKSPLAPTTILRRDPTEHDVQIEILFCGICHSDLHQVRNEWSEGCPLSIHAFPAMRSSAVSPRSAPQSPSSSPGTLPQSAAWLTPTAPAPSARTGLEQFCPNMTLTYNSPDKHLGGVTYGGYSDSIVVDEHFVLRVPSNLDLAGAAPLLCAGITTYSPMRHWGVTKGKKVGVVGLGGLGHMAVKFAHALGAHVVVFTTSPSKKEDALRLGADEVVVSRNADEMRSMPAASTLSSTRSPPITTSMPTCTCFAATATSPWSAHRKAACRRRLWPSLGASQPLWIAHRRHRGNPGDARLLRQTQHHRRCGSHPNPEGQRGLREAVPCGCEVPLLDRHGFPEGLMVKNGHQVRRLTAFHQMAGGVLHLHSEN